MDIEEEPLLPLVRNRKTKPVQNVKIQRAAHFEDLKKNNEELNNALPYGGKVYLKRQKKPDHYYVIIFEIFLLLIAFLLLYLCYQHPQWFHYKVTRTYAHLGHTHAQHMVGEKLMHGHGVEMNQTEALAWFKLAAKSGHPHSSYNLAVAHLNGLNADLEDGEDEELLRHAADNGVEEAGDVLTHLCSTGQCRGTDREEELLDN